MGINSSSVSGIRQREITEISFQKELEDSCKLDLIYLELKRIREQLQIITGEKDDY